VARFLVIRTATGLLTLLALSVLVFLACSVLPGDAASQILGKHATGQQLAELQAELGLDRPLWQQYLDWLGGLVQGDLGTTVAGHATGTEVSVWSQIQDKVTNSATLAVVAFVPIVLASLVLGTLAALRAGRWADHLISALTLVPAALPEFVAGALFIAVGFSWLGWFPPVSLVPPGSSPLASPDVLVLPVLTLLAVTVGPASRMIRAGMLESLRSEWVRAARLNGVAERWVVVGYGLRNAVAPSIQVFALIAQYLIGGLIIVEYLFDYPGLGKELVSAVNARDSIEVQSVTMLLAAAIVVITIIADLLVILMVPRLRTEWS